MTQPLKLTATSLKVLRANLLALQAAKCELCLREPRVPCLDHNHKTGAIRGVLCRGCNAMLGHLENNAPRHDLADPYTMRVFLGRVANYLHTHMEKPLDILHPTYKTPEEKLALQRKKAKLKRTKAKAEKSL